MFMGTMHKNEDIKICMLGASFDTGNMGVSAIAESAIKCILHRWPGAEITVLDSDGAPDERWLRIGDKDLRIRELPIRFCKNIFLDNHFLVLSFYALLFKVFRWEKFKRFCTRRNASLRCITQMDMVADITGGDSFSDIYGMRRFILGFLRKWLVLMFNKDLVMLPQTYGPFKRTASKAMAKYILRKSKAIYSRDKNSADYGKMVLRNQNSHGKVRFCPDVGFILDARRPEKIDIGNLENVRKKDITVVGLNVSGLLYNGGHTRNERFGLKIDYRQLVCQVARRLLENHKVKLLLVPHVIPPAPATVNDAVACLQIYKRLAREYPGRIFLVKGEYDQGEIKYLIGLCDFFVGSRMHSCIAALSQAIPAVGLAYSDKFKGVFETVDVEQFVLDMRHNNVEQILTTVSRAFEQRKITARHLKTIVPRIQKRILDLFKGIS
jgi:polysaccharide pyruvyl transferase WcaK-like protein